MESLQKTIEAHLCALRQETSTDFAALAWSDSEEQTIRWKFASGNRNQRYKKIVLRQGMGIAGYVIRTGRPTILSSFSPKSVDDPREYPILLAEGLQSVVAVPVTVQGRVRGVLLVGCREARTYDDQTVLQVSESAERLSDLLQEGLDDHHPTKAGL